MSDDISGVLGRLARLEALFEQHADAETRRLDRIETTIEKLNDLASNAKGGWFALTAAASIGAALAGLLVPLLKKLGV